MNYGELTLEELNKKYNTNFEHCEVIVVKDGEYCRGFMKSGHLYFEKFSHADYDTVHKVLWSKINGGLF